MARKRVVRGSLLTGDERARIKRIGEPIALFLGRLGFSPDALTLIGFSIVLFAAAAAAAGNWVLAALILIAGTLFDGLDGTLARATNRVRPFGAFLDSSLDRASEAVIYAGITAGAAMSTTTLSGSGHLEVIGLATLALGTGSLVSYVRARGEGLGVIADNGLAQRGERAAMLIIGLLAGGLINATWLAGALALICVTSTITVVQRVLYIRDALESGARQPRAAKRRAH
ncbi:MAG: CDP-alcohol phosphatidyltransferase [Chloroflexota bacterium]|jgi:CDP-diacylglycerol--glycerol-3-phosphate 3-phosphatidyltransferase